MSWPAYPEYKDSTGHFIGEIPRNWQVNRLKRLVSPNRPITYGIVQAGEHVEDGVPYIRPIDMGDESGVIDPGSLMRTAPDIARIYSRSSVAEGDLVCSIGPSFGKVMQVPATLDGANLTQGTARVAVARQTEARFVFWALRSLEAHAQWESSIGGATFRALNLGPLAETVIPQPDRHEQAIIADFLDHETARIDALIEEQQRLIELLQEKCQAVIAHAVTKGLDLDVPMKDSGIEWLGSIPRNWDVVRISRLYADCNEPGSERLPVLSVSLHSGVSNHELRENEADRKITRIEDREKYKRVRSNDLVYNMMRAWQGAFGAVMVDGLVSPAYVVARPKRRVVSSFIEQQLRTPSAVEELRRHSYGITDFRLRLYWDEFRSIAVAMPPINEQRSIMRFIEDHISKSKHLKSEANRGIQLLKEHRSALISAAVTGKIDVRGWKPQNAPVESELPHAAETEAPYG